MCRVKLHEQMVAHCFSHWSCWYHGHAYAGKRANSFESLEKKGKWNFLKLIKAKLNIWTHKNREMRILYSVVWRKCVHIYVTKSKLTLPQDRPVNLRRSVEASNTTLFGKSTDWEDGGLRSQNNHLIRVWMPGSFIEQSLG